MQAWIRRRSKVRKDGRMVFITSVVFDAHVFDKLCNYVDQDNGQRSAIVNEAVRYALATPGWIEKAIERLSGEEVIAVDSPRQVPSSNSRLHAKNAVDGPATRRSSPARPLSRPASSSKPGTNSLPK